jgi:hypothetical protein
MANEITVTIKGVLSNGYLKDSFDPGQVTITQSAKRAARPVIDVGTTEEALVTTDVSTLGWVFFRNLDTTNFVDIGPESAGAMVAMVRLKAGECAAMRLKPGITLRAKADTAAVLLEMKLWND